MYDEPLTIVVPERELYDEIHNEFISVPGCTLQLKHSLRSVAKWESKWNVAYLSNRKKTLEESIDYIRCMTLSKNVNPVTYYALTEENFKAIEEYINAPMTASFIPQPKENRSRSNKMTAEEMYYCMISYGIPIEFEKWQLNRLIALIRVFDIKNQPKKRRRSEAQLIRDYAALNAKRCKELNTRG